ncbi:MAG: hypothetical protein UT63_C0056G0003 [Candidatus Gottesmanbacteria bacterium GW2011_GWC2_39_8]|uniref:VOC domain-containing protein n=1 Tax=Candidatus Gottesmanbacteria bacterium GW2011_GWC2_39_8 TaxID=1618450 RepID=A0A0G0PUT9_9BACT|nr:MAG: hypothetical protein UT63_C0056G0003 [Candidatus Gottesmanbacteria bacterium GW2011_GWC2_39_8]
MFSKYRILIFTENPDELMKFYRDVLELPLDEANSLKLPNDYGYMFTVNGDWKLWIGRHSGIKGASKEPFRHIFNLYVGSVGEWYDKIKSRGAKIVSEPCETPFSTPEKPFWVSTFLDPENNCFQFMGLP